MADHIPFPTTGFVRLKFILAPRGPLPVGKSTWWAGVKTGRYPRPRKLGPRITAWKVEDIRALLDELANPPQIDRARTEAGTGGTPGSVASAARAGTPSPVNDAGNAVPSENGRARKP